MKAVEVISHNQLQVLSHMTEGKSYNSHYIINILKLNYFKNKIASDKKLIQNTPGGKVNILGGYNISHSKQKSVYVHVFSSDQFPRWS
jgi:hypothetical protein